MTWVGMPLIGLVIVGLIGLGLAAALAIESQSIDIFSTRFAGVVMFVIGLWLGASYLHAMRHLYAFRTQYMLSETGVSIEARDRSRRQLAWTDFEFAIDNRLLRYIQLASSQLDRPVVLMFGTPGAPALRPEEKLQLARHLIAEKLGVRFRRQWW